MVSLKSMADFRQENYYVIYVSQKVERKKEKRMIILWFSSPFQLLMCMCVCIAL